MTTVMRCDWFQHVIYFFLQNMKAHVVSGGVSYAEIISKLILAVGGLNVHATQYCVHDDG